MVENSTIGLSRNMTYLKGVSEATGVHIVAGTGLVNYVFFIINITYNHIRIISKYEIRHIAYKYIRYDLNPYINCF